MCLPFYPLHSKSSLVKLETPLLLQVLATSSLLVQVILSRPVEALTQVKLYFQHTSLASRQPPWTFTSPTFLAPHTLVPVVPQSTCYDPGPYHQFSAIFHRLFLRSRSLIPHLFPHAPLGPPSNHLTSHLMDHLTIPQSDITCHHSAVHSTPQYHHLTHYGLPAHCHVMIDRQLMMELYLELPAHDEPYYM